MSFPLYDILIKEINTKKILKKDKVELIRQIKKLEDKHSLIYAIIRCHQLKNEKNNLELPYSCVKKELNLEFDLENFPDELVRILTVFIQKELQRID